MKIVFNIDVGVNVDSYKEAGKILDKVASSLEEIIGDKGKYDIGSFQARHRNVHEFSDQVMTAEMPMRERDYEIKGS